MNSFPYLILILIHEWRYFNLILTIYRSSTVIKALRYKSEGRWFDPS